MFDRRHGWLCFKAGQSRAALQDDRGNRRLRRRGRRRRRRRATPGWRLGRRLGACPLGWRPSIAEGTRQGISRGVAPDAGDRKSTRLNSSHLVISYAVFCLKKKKNKKNTNDNTH